MSSWFSRHWQSVTSAAAFHNGIGYAIGLANTVVHLGNRLRQSGFLTSPYGWLVDIVAIALAFYWLHRSFSPPANRRFRFRHAMSSTFIAVLAAFTVGQNAWTLPGGSLKDEAAWIIARQAAVAASWVAAAVSWCIATVPRMRRSDGQFWNSRYDIDHDDGQGPPRKESYYSRFSSRAAAPITLRRWYLEYRGKYHPIVRDKVFRQCAMKSPFFFRVVYTPREPDPLGYWQVVPISEVIFEQFASHDTGGELLSQLRTMPERFRHKQLHEDLMTRHAVRYEDVATVAGARCKLFLYVAGLVCSRRASWVPEPDYQETPLFGARARALRLDLCRHLLDLATFADVNLIAYTDSTDGDKLAEWCDAKDESRLDEHHRVFTVRSGSQFSSLTARIREHLHKYSDYVPNCLEKDRFLFEEATSRLRR